MIALMDFYRARFKASFAVSLQYRVALAIWMLGLVLEPVIYLSVWTSVAESSGGQVGGFTPQNFAGYYIVVMIIQHFTLIWHMWEYDYIIRQGQLSGRLLRPIHPIHNDAAENLVYKFIMLTVLIPAVIILTLVFRPALNPPLWAALAFIPALLLSGTLAFLAGWAVAMTAFWTTRTFAINQMYFVSMFFFSGQVAPLSLLPDFIQTLANLLPFRWIVSFPAELMMGRLTPQETLSGFAAQIFFIVLSMLAARTAWRSGVKQYTAMGG